MDSGKKALIVLAVVILLGIVVEFGLVGGGVYDVIRTILLILITLAVVVAVALIGFLVYANKKRSDPLGKEESESRASVRSSSSLESLGQRYSQRSELKIEIDELNISNTKLDVDAALDDSKQAADKVKGAVNEILEH